MTPDVERFPDPLTVKRFVRAEFCTAKILADWLVNPRSTSAVAVVEVASIVATLCPPKLVVVPMPSWSEIVVKVIFVPLSVKPEVFTVEVDAQTGRPFETVSTWPGVELSARFVSTFPAEA